MACDGYRYGGVAHDRTALLRDVVAELPSVRDVVLVARARRRGRCRPARLGIAPSPRLRCAGRRRRAIAPRPLPFDHPLWIVYSSGTTGLPKAIVHGHGGVMLEALKFGTLHNDCGPSVVSGDRYHWYSTTGWIMWNSQMSALLGGTTICVYDGSPAGPRSSLPGDQREVDWTTLWRFVAATGATFFGAGAAFSRAARRPASSRSAAGDLSLPARARLDRLAAGDRELSLAARARACRSMASRSGSPPSRAAPTSRAASSPGCAPCRSSTARCSAAASAPRSRRGRSPTPTGTAAPSSTRSASSSA